MKEVLKMALEALQDYVDEYGPWSDDSGAQYVLRVGKEALAQQEERNFCPRCGKRLGQNDWDIHTCTPPQLKEQEPVAWMKKMFSPELGEFFDYKDGAFARETDCQGWTPLYTAPPQRTWVGLTLEEVEATFWPWKQLTEYSIPLFEYRVIARAIEAKLKEKNT